MSLARARRSIAAAVPRAREAHRLGGPDGGHLFIPDGSRLYDLAPDLAARVDAALAAPAGLGELLDRLGFGGTPRIKDAPPAPPPVHALSLAIAQKCNLGCTYCYAQQGSFGASPRDMALADALRAVDLLIDGAAPGARLTLAFLGGEPLANRAALRAATEHGAARAAERGLDLRFSVTTNATLLSPDDAAFFAAHRFAVTVSLDGPREVHDALRPMKGGGGSFDRIAGRLAPLLARDELAVSARVTVTPANLALKATLDAFLAMGFASVGFSPLLSAPTGRGEMQAGDFETMLGAMIECGEAFEAAVLAGRPYPFANMQNAMREIERGTHRPYPCGAGAGYLGVAADGAFAACHRFVGDDARSLGSLASGIDDDARADWLASRHVHTQEPCRRCWARYLCGGGCHHEVINRGRPACDYIRGWLHYCLEAYLRLTAAEEANPAAAR